MALTKKRETSAESSVKRPLIDTILRSLVRWMPAFQDPAVTQEAKHRDPFRILISCMLSLRTKDPVTSEATDRLFALASGPQALASLPLKKVEQAIFPVGFYRTKARNIRKVCTLIHKDFRGTVPEKMNALLELPGVGRKTANLVLGLGFGKPAICVDTHVHRISNRLGWVKTKSPVETEQALQTCVPRPRWIQLNTLLVTFGQNVCKPVSPYCSGCRIRKHCPRVGVERSR